MCSPPWPAPDPRQANFFESYAASIHWSMTQFTPATTNIAPANGIERRNTHLSGEKTGKGMVYWFLFACFCYCLYAKAFWHHVAKNAQHVQHMIMSEKSV
jgi:hypothetical protein